MPPANEVQDDEVFKPKIPFLLRMVQNRRALGGGAPDEDQQRSDVLNQLAAKRDKLSSVCGLLEMKRAVTTDLNDLGDISRELGKAQDELFDCTAHYNAIAADEPFTWPGPEAETALLAAIAEVDQTVAVNAAIDALLFAVDKLVQAFKASDTDAAPASG